MSSEITTGKSDDKQAVSPRRVVRLRVAWVLLVTALIISGGIALLSPAAPPNGTVRVWGKLGQRDVEAIRLRVTRERQKGLWYSMIHLRFRSLWDQVRVLHTCPLVGVSSVDGRKVTAVCTGRTWDGNQIDIAYEFTNSSGVWKSLSVTSSERIGQQRGQTASPKSSSNERK